MRLRAANRSTTVLMCVYFVYNVCRSGLVSCLVEVMVRLPRGVEQLVTAYLTGALVQRVRGALTQLSRSPTVLRATERVLHEWDTLPQRLAGRPVPYTPRDYGQPEGRVSDIGAWCH